MRISSPSLISRAAFRPETGCRSTTTSSRVTGTSIVFSSVTTSLRTLTSPALTRSLLAELFFPQLYTLAVFPLGLGSGSRPEVGAGIEKHLPCLGLARTGLDRHQNSTLAEATVVVLRFFLWNGDADQRSEQTARRGTYSGAGQGRGECATCNDRPHAWYDQGTHSGP
jgi:hypothetical protein